MTDTAVQSNYQMKLSLQQPLTESQREILSDDALLFLERLVDRFAERVPLLLEDREQRQRQIDRGQLPDFDPETESIRQSEWKIQNIPQDLQDRRVEITGPVDRKMVINALNANVKVFMADFEDSFAPAWNEVIEGQRNLRDAVNGTIDYVNPGEWQTLSISRMIR